LKKSIKECALFIKEREREKEEKKNRGREKSRKHH
jgi:hypothetical protein